jgi:Glycosyltransferase family 87
VAFGLYEGQDSFLLFALIALAYRQFRAGKDVSAGILLGLCLFKFQIVIPMVVALMFMSRLRALKFGAAFLATAAAAFTASWVTVGTSGLLLYRHMMTMDSVEHAERMANIRGIVGTLGGGAVLTVILSA